MTAVAAIKLLTFLESVLLGVLANREDPSSKSNGAFIRYIFFVAAQSFVELMLVSSPSEQAFLFWKHFDVFAYFAVASLFQFSLLLRGYRWSSGRRFNAVLYGAVAAVACSEGFLMRPERAVRGTWSFASVYADSFRQIHASFVVVAAVLALLTVVVLSQCLIHAKDRRSRAQASIFFWSTLCLVAAGSAIELHSAFLPHQQLPLSATATSAYLFVNPILAFAVVRYGLLQLSPISAISAIMDLMSESVILTDQHGNIEYMNTAARTLTGRLKLSGVKESLGRLGLRNGRSCSTPLDYEQLRNDGKGLRDHECVIETVTKEPLRVSVSSTVLGTRLWGETGLILTLRDISERCKMEDLRDSADRIMRHDLRNTLTGIYALSGTLVADPSLNNEQVETVGMIHEGARLLHEQIDSYLYLRSVEDGSFKVPLERVDLLGVLHSVRRNLEGLASSMNVHLALFVDGESDGSNRVIHVNGIRAMLFGIFVNLVKNAIEASPFGSEVRVTLTTDGQVVVAIHNRGVIPEEIRPRFFTKFATAGKRRGAGIGAYGAHKLAEALGCAVTFTTSEEQGTEIVVRFPPMAAES